MPLDLIMGLSEKDDGTVRAADEFVQEVKERSKDCYEIARKHLQVAAERRKKSYDIQVKEAEFGAGDWVWYWYPRRYQRRSPKWQLMYTGPYLIVRVIAPVNYVLQKSPRSKPFVTHADKLKKCHGQTPVNWLTTDTVGVDVASAVHPEDDQIEATAVTPTAEPQKCAPIVRPARRPVPLIDDGNDERSGDATSTRPRRQNRMPPSKLADFIC